MKISYPIRDKDGKEFRSLDEIMQRIDAEAHGTWLLGGNGLWHGAVHISEVSNPRSALTPDTLSTGEPVPLQFMADGTIAAYRINNDYLKGPYKGQELRYSSTFVLVKSQCQPDPQKEKSWLEFYSLYMHLAPVKDYPASLCYKVRAGHSGILLRKYTSGQNGLPETQESGDPVIYQAPPKTRNSLKAGDRFASSCTGRFYVTRGEQSTLMTFGLVRLLNGETAGNEQYWVTLDPTLMEPDGEIQALIPAWMQKAKAKGVFDQVQAGGETEEWQVSAGTPVGFMGCEEYPGKEGSQTEREWFVHLEVLSADPRMPAFLGNPEGVKGEKRTVRAPKGKILYTRQATAEQATFSATSATLEAQYMLPRITTTPVMDASKQWWFNITGSGWLPETDVTEAGQYDLLKQGFQPLEENSGGDMVSSPYEGWVPEAFDSVSRAAAQGDEWYEQVPPFYRELMVRMDSDQDGKVTEEEIRQALVVRDPLVRHVVNRLVIKHHSEWCGGRSTGRWEGFYRDLDTEETAYCEKWQSDLEWMSGVPPFNNDEPVWHFHPVVFLDTIKGKSKITRQMLRRIWTNSGNVSDSVLDVVAEEFSNKFEKCRINTKNRLYHFFAQIYQEVGSAFNLNEGFNYRPQVLIDKFSYYRNHSQYAQIDGYIPGRQAANKQNIANRAYGGREGNNDIASGDGWRYRGRGMKQLTFRNNYRSFTVYHEKVWGEYVDFELNPDLLLEIVYAARSALYFWDYNNLYSRADNGISRDVSDSITRIVNLYDNHYADRYNNLMRFIQDGVFDEIL
ncbi:glycoside hydrolase family 19 protein [Salmonella enterica]